LPCRSDLRVNMIFFSDSCAVRLFFILVRPRVFVMHLTAFIEDMLRPAP
jgi:hypothetical protein